MRAVATAALALAVLVAGACSDDAEFPDDTAEVDVGDRTIDMEVVSCGRDVDEGVFVLGAASSDAFLQLLLVIDDDEIVIERSAVTLERDGGGVIGAGDAGLLGAEPGAPGEITSASIDGDRVDLEADARPLASASSGVASASSGASGETEAARIDLVARCGAVAQEA